jgi:aminoglycoside phosphotransferase (APT) family kinase protein
MPGRPTPDRDLDESIALNAVQEQLPWLAGRGATHLGSGWATDVYLLDNRLTARFPRNAEAAEWIDFDQAVLGLVASSVPSAFCVPRVIGRGKAGSYFPYDFLICEFVSGVEADRVGAPVSDGLASDLGRALTQIHSISLDDAHNVGLRQADWDNYAGTLRVLHGDLKHNNIIVDPTSGRLAGIIDWGNAAVGDPAMDFMSLVLWRGWRFMHAALSAYELAIDEGFLDRVRLMARLEALQWLTDSIKRGVDAELPLSWLRNAFSLTSAA